MHKLREAVCFFTTAPQILDEMYHEDRGFVHTHAVFLSPSPPGLDVQHVLAVHGAASKLTYIQGSPFRTAVGLF
jgi:hypothetical protein